jgi:hypothetical protein
MKLLIMSLLILYCYFYVSVIVVIAIIVVLLTAVRCSETSRASNGTLEDFQSGSTTSHPEVHISLRRVHEAKIKQGPSGVQK